MKIIEQDKSGAGGPSGKIRVPALDFNVLQSNIEQEMVQQVDEHQLDDDQQELQDLVDAANGIGALDQDLNSLTEAHIDQPQDQNAPPPQMKQFAKQKTNMPIMNISMAKN